MEQSNNQLNNHGHKELKIIHLSSAHGDRDVRIFLKECASLAKVYPNQVHLILAGVEERTEDGVSIHSVAKVRRGRLSRMWRTVNEVSKLAIDLKGDIYHLHDPELLRIALKLKRKGKIVVYDAHEDLPRQLLGKSYLPFKFLFAVLFELFENFVVKKLDGVVCATPYIADRFKKINPNTVAINNFPLISEIDFSVVASEIKENKVCFIGGISQIRGTRQLVEAMDKTKTSLALAGAIDVAYMEELVGLKGWRNVDALGFINRKQALKLKQTSIAGMVTFLPYPNHINAQPNKIFEYMAAGLPVIGSNFPLWKEIIEGNNCGICVDPTDSTAIATAIDTIANNKELAEVMGHNGSRLVKEKYNWAIEEEKLVLFYRQLINEGKV